MGRMEQDSLGPIEVPEERYWGAQTQRCLENFEIGTARMPPAIVHALGAIKRAAARVNVGLGLLDEKLGAAIEQAAGEVARGERDEEFPLGVWQTGSGTQTHMNANEVIAGRANEILTGSRGGKEPVHPNDHCNRGQSSNDTFPTAMHVASVMRVEAALKPALAALRDALAKKADSFADVAKIGRTHLQDAVPLTVGQEFSAWARQVDLGVERLDAALPRVRQLAQGGTAVGTGLNTHPEFATRFARELSQATGQAFEPAANPFEALGAHDAMVELSGALNTIACSLNKVANDLRLLGSGPRCGIGELVLPKNEPGSSIMPGKVNPTQAEAMAMVCSRVMGNHTTVTIAGAQGQLQVHVQKPVIADAVLQSIEILAGACRSLTEHCVEGIELNRDRIAHHLDQSLMLVTALAPHVGYDQAAAIAQHAAKHGTTLREAAAEVADVDGEQFDAWVDARAMAHPHDERSSDSDAR